jgi:hypothetical protein
LDVFDQPGPFVEITGVTLPSFMKACRCGARVFDVHGYTEHSNLRATCVACGATLAENVPRSIFGVENTKRATRFRVSQSTRFDTFRRDKFCCAHCGQPAPRGGDAFDKVRSMLVSIVGSEHRLVVARNAHAATCISCGSLLPGILQSIPYDVVQAMAPHERIRLFDLLDGQRLTIDHLFPVSILEIDSVVNGSIENDLVTSVFLATSCMDCNLGRREKLEEWGELKGFLENVILRDRHDRKELIGHAQEIYFRASLQIKRRAG